MASAISSSPTRHDVVDVAPRELEGVLAHAPDRDPVGDGRAGGTDARARRERRAACRDRRGLDADDAHVRDVAPSARAPMPADQTAAADRDQHRIEVGHLLEQLEADRALAGDDTRVVEGMDEDELALGLDLAARA